LGNEFEFAPVPRPDHHHAAAAAATTTPTTTHLRVRLRRGRPGRATAAPASGSSGNFAKCDDNDDDEDEEDEEEDEEDEEEEDGRALVSLGAAGWNPAASAAAISRAMPPSSVSAPAASPSSATIYSRNERGWWRV
jgi:hypothetical protein